MTATLTPAPRYAVLGVLSADELPGTRAAWRAGWLAAVTTASRVT